MLISIEGNIGSGKTTLFNILEKTLLLNDYNKKKFMKEPIDKWLNLKDNSNTNILELFYKDKSKWSFSFQICAFISKIKELEKYLIDSDIIITERTVLTDRECFAKELYENKLINEIDWILYNDLYDIMVKPAYIPNGIVYLECDPTISLDRVNKRNRSEESGIPLNYLNQIHTRHEEWLSATTIPILRINVDENYLNNKEQLDDIISKIQVFINNL
jgi:deoxyadenosine/deoxycytidine kinase